MERQFGKERVEGGKRCSLNFLRNAEMVAKEQVKKLLFGLRY